MLPAYGSDGSDVEFCVGLLGVMLLPPLFDCVMVPAAVMLTALMVPVFRLMLGVPVLLLPRPQLAPVRVPELSTWMSIPVVPSVRRRAC